MGWTTSRHLWRRATGQPARGAARGMTARALLGGGGFAVLLAISLAALSLAVTLAASIGKYTSRWRRWAVDDQPPELDRCPDQSYPGRRHLGPASQPGAGRGALRCGTGHLWGDPAIAAAQRPGRALCPGYVRRCIHGGGGRDHPRRRRGHRDAVGGGLCRGVGGLCLRGAAVGWRKRRAGCGSCCSRRRR